MTFFCTEITNYLTARRILLPGAGRYDNKYGGYDFIFQGQRGDSLCEEAGDRGTREEGGGKVEFWIRDILTRDICGCALQSLGGHLEEKGGMLRMESIMRSIER